MIEEVLIPSKSKFLSIRINPLRSIWIKNNRISHRSGVMHYCFFISHAMHLTFTAGKRIPKQEPLAQFTFPAKARAKSVLQSDESSCKMRLIYQWLNMKKHKHNGRMTWCTIIFNKLTWRASVSICIWQIRGENRLGSVDKICGCRQGKKERLKNSKGKKRERISIHLFSERAPSTWTRGNGILVKRWWQCLQSCFGEKVAKKKPLH